MPLRGSVPHSGNNCSGLCTTPCTHEDCWQCEDHRSRPEEIAQVYRRRLSAFESAKKPKGLLGALPAQKPRDHDKTVITRAALEALCEKAGLAMDWNDGNPIIRDGGEIRDREARYSAEERKLLEERVKELERIAAQQRDGLIDQKTANSMAKAVAQQTDVMTSDILRRKVDETLVADMKANEKRAISQLKEGGATDADIEAAQALLGWKPE